MARTTKSKLFFSITFGSLLVLVSLGAGFAMDGDTRGDDRPTDIPVGNCFVEIIDDVEVPAHVAGPLKEILFKEGMTVKIGDLLAVIDDQMAQRRTELAEAKWSAATRRANDSIEVQYAQAAYEVANKEWEISYNLRKKGAVSASEYEKSKFERRKAELQIQRSKNEREISAIDATALEVEHKTALDNVERHKMNSPVVGIVKAVHKNAQEWVEVGESVMQVVRLDRVRVKGWIDSTQYDVHEIHGRPVTVTYKAKNGTEVPFQAKIDFVDLQTRSDKYLVWAEVDNKMIGEHWLLLAGAPVAMQIHLGPPVRISQVNESKESGTSFSAPPQSTAPMKKRSHAFNIPNIKSDARDTSNDGVSKDTYNTRPNLQPSKFQPIRPQLLPTEGKFELKKSSDVRDDGRDKL